MLVIFLYFSRLRFLYEGKKIVLEEMNFTWVLSGSVFSKVFGTMWPDNGTIYLSQNMNFIRPMYPFQKYSARFMVIKVISKNKFLVKTTVTNMNNEITIDRDAKIKYEG